MRKSNLILLSIVFLLFSGGRIYGQKKGIIADRVAIFYSTDLVQDTSTIKMLLLTPPTISSSLPTNWSVNPVYSKTADMSRASIAISPTTDLYGSGEVTGKLRRNGTKITLWNTDNGNYTRNKGDRLYQSHPWIMGVRADGTAFGVMFCTSWKASLECKTDSIVFSSYGPSFPVITIDKSSPQEVLKSLAELTGKMELPPLWALGYQQCRWSYNPASKVREIASEFRKRKLPCDVIWMDIDYMEGFRVFTFSKKEFPDPKGLSADLHKQGFKGVWMIDPGIKVDANYSVYTSGKEKDLFVKAANGSEYNGNVWPGACAFPDFTNPTTTSWWAGLYKEFMANGLDGVWNDMNEPAVFGGVDWTMPIDNKHTGGGGLPAGSHLQYHNVYGMNMAKATQEGIRAANPDKRPFVLTRSNFLGGQRYAATWTGDNYSSEAHMKLSIPMTLTLGMSGQPFNGPDLGGFNGKVDTTLWAKWVGMGTFFPFCRGHAEKGANNKEPWAFGKAVENTARIALERRYRLLPYLYTLFDESARTGLPVMRAVFMADPTDLNLRKEEQAFMLGSDLLITPRWATNVKLPKGNWREFSLIKGDKEDMNQASLKIRQGAIIPVGKVIQNTTEANNDKLTLLVSLDANGKADGVLYEDAGDGLGYQTGDFLRTYYHAKLVNGKVKISITKTEGNRKALNRKITVQQIL